MTREKKKGAVSLVVTWTITGILALWTLLTLIAGYIPSAIVLVLSTVVICPLIDRFLFRMPGRIGKIISHRGTRFVLGFALFIVSVMLVPELPQEASPASLSSTLISATPTAKPTPTATLQTPTASPVPTATLTPSPKPTPTMTPLATATPTPIESPKAFTDFGKQLSLIDNGDGICVLKYKIEPSFSDNATVNQNYHTIVNFIVSGGGNQYTEIQYWAVADMSDGHESKVISFTLDTDTIQKVYDKKIVATELGEYATDLWILPSLTGTTANNTSTSHSENVSSKSESTQPTATPASQHEEKEEMVWIPQNGGKKYHTRSSCSNMDDPIQVTISEAKRQGFTACKRCH